MASLRANRPRRRRSTCPGASTVRAILTSCSYTRIVRTYAARRSPSLASLLVTQPGVVAIEARLHLLGDGLQLGRDGLTRDGIALDLRRQVHQRPAAVAPEPGGDPRGQLRLEVARFPEGRPHGALVHA